MFFSNKSWNLLVNCFVEAIYGFFSLQQNLSRYIYYRPQQKAPKNFAHRDIIYKPPSIGSTSF